MSNREAKGAAPLGTAVVTGASTGIGAVYAERLAGRGHDVVLVARDRDRLEALARDIAARHGRNAEIIAADLTARPDLAAVEARLAKDDVTVLVNNAGIAIEGGVATANVDRAEAMIDLNVVALTRLTLAALPGLVERHGALMNIASVVPLIPESFPGIYGSTKAFVIHFSQSLHAELAQKGLKVQAVLPGATATAIWEKSGRPLESLPPEIVMPVEDMVDAALTGFDQGELVTIPSLADPADWTAFEAARLALGPNLSHRTPAARYRQAAERAA